MPETALQLRTEIQQDGTLQLLLVDEPVPEPAADEVLVKVEAAPINPSDLGLLFGPVDFGTASQSGTAPRPVITAKIPPHLMPVVKARVGASLPAGNEGAGTVVKAGAGCQNLQDSTVAMLGGAMYSQYRVMPANQCLPVPEGISARDCAASQVNPMTALGLTETMRLEGHTALVNTAAASSLGQMLVKICLKDGIDLVNIVRSRKQVELLKAMGAKYVVDSSDDNFMPDLINALAATHATIAFDAIGGGGQGGQILTAMEQVALKNMATYSRYGSDTFKQLYIYGNLDTSPTTFNRSFGAAWSINAWLLTPFLQKIGPAKIAQLQQRIAAELTTTFATHYSDTVTLAGMLNLDVIKSYASRRTNGKYLVTPWA